jgi:hypothetical protein
MQVQKSILPTRQESSLKQIYFLLNPNTNKLQEYYKQSKTEQKKRVGGINKIANPPITHINKQQKKFL